MATITVYEHQRVAVAPTASDIGTPCLSPTQFEQLAALSEKQPGLLQLQHRAVKFGHHCGVIQLADDCLEILPKIYRETAPQQSNRALLLEMLAGCRDLPIKSPAPAALALQNRQLLEIFIQHFCRELFAQLHRGLIRQYRVRADNLSLVRGRIDWSAQIRDNLLRPERLHCEFDELSEDNPANRAIRATLKLLLRHTHGRIELQRQLRDLLYAFEGVADCPVSADEVTALPRNRMTRRYAGVFQWCELFLRGQSPDLYTGRQPALALLFDMNRLFQDYVFQRLQEVISREPAFHHLQVRSERPARNLLQRSDLPNNTQSLFQMRPDILVFDGNDNRRALAIIDTKWKLLKEECVDRRRGISQADVYQMLAYARGYRCRSLALLYPAHGHLKPRELPRFEFRPTVANGDTEQLHIAAISLSDGPAGELAARVRQQLISLLDELLTPRGAISNQAAG